MARDVFSVVTGQIVNLLEKGIVPWRRPWSGCGPVSYQSNLDKTGEKSYGLGCKAEAG